jgi:uncharacterized DUF497 family protein
MQYVWDPAKDVLNRRKHGLSLADGIVALEDRIANRGLMTVSITAKSASLRWALC